MVSKNCPECSAVINIELPSEIGQQVTCLQCGLLLEIIWLFPIELAVLDTSTENVLNQPDEPLS